MPQPARTPYQSIIDELASKTAATSARAKRAAENQPFPTAAHAEFNALLATLEPTQRELLASVLLRERRSAVHDTLAVLSARYENEGVVWSHEGLPLPMALSGMGLHGDFAGRLDGWEWPDEA